MFQPRVSPLLLALIGPWLLLTVGVLLLALKLAIGVVLVWAGLGSFALSIVWGIAALLRGLSRQP